MPSSGSVSGASGTAAFKLDPARLVYSLRWKHNAEPPISRWWLIQDEPPGWVNTANLTLLSVLRQQAPDAIDWDAWPTWYRCSTLSRPRGIVGPHAGIE